MSSSEWQQQNFITFKHIFLSFRDTPEWEHDDENCDVWMNNIWLSAPIYVGIGIHSLTIRHCIAKLLSFGVNIKNCRRFKVAQIFQIYRHQDAVVIFVIFLLILFPLFQSSSSSKIIPALYSRIFCYIFFYVGKFYKNRKHTTVKFYGNTLFRSKNSKFCYVILSLFPGYLHIIWFSYAHVIRLPILSTLNCMSMEIF